MAMGLVSLESVGKASRLETQAGVDSTVLRQMFSLLWEIPVFPLKAPAHPLKGNLLYLKSADWRC